MTIIPKKQMLKHRAMKKAILAAAALLICLGGNDICAQEQPRWSARIDTVGVSGYYNINLSPMLVGLSHRSGFEDMRILDDTGGEVPYIVRRTNPVREVERMKMYTLLHNAGKDSVNVLIVDNTARERIDCFYIVMREADVEMTAYVHGPIVLSLLREAGYDDSYQVARELANKVLLECRELDLLYPRTTPSPEANLPREPVNFIVSGEWPVRGRAAADESNGTRVPDTDEFDDSLQPPEGLTCVPVIGNSMSPLVLDGQYVLIDNEREGFEVDGGIVVASIREPEADDERTESMTGTFVKRCYDGGNGLYYFTSINEYSPFSAWADHCRMWPVIGVWFAGKGKPPTE